MSHDTTRNRLHQAAASLIEVMKPGCRYDIKEMSIVGSVWSYMLYLRWWEGKTQYTVTAAFNALYEEPEEWVDRSLRQEISGRGEPAPPAE